MEPWGEFIDTEWYREGVIVPTPVDPITLDPWRARYAGGVVLVPRDILEAVVQPEQLRFCEQGDLTKVYEVRLQISMVGLLEPLELVVDSYGHVILRDGHHRLVATRGWDHFNYLPCVLTRADKIRTNGYGTLDVMLFDLLRRVVPA